jgi:hypothetical protein
MIKFKSKYETSMDAFMSCAVVDCEEEAEKLWSTESNVIDVCQKHFNELQEEYMK